MMKTFREALAEDRRLVILKLLNESGEYTANAYLLQSALEGFGHGVSLDAVVSDLAWLADVDLVSTRLIGECTVATLTLRGLDVAAGRAAQPGVKRPLPGTN